MPYRGLVHVELLGPLRVESGEGEIALQAAKERLLVCALALRPGSVVSVDGLITALWGDRPPASARKTLQTYVSNLRRSLGAKAIRTEAPGYVLDAAVGDVDALQFRALLRAGEEALRRGFPDEASRLLAEGLSLWRGDPFGSVMPDSGLAAEEVRLREEHLTALEARATAEIACGRHGEVVGELEVLIRGHPFREPLWANLALALYRSGRQADALAACQRAGTTLREELGLEPGAQLRGLEHALLSHDPSLDRIDRVATTPAPGAIAEQHDEPAPTEPPLRRVPLRYATCPDGIRIAYEVVGDGAIDLIVVPGIAFHLDIWWDRPLDSLVHRLASSCRVILFDKRGMGLSDRPLHIDVEDWTEDTLAVLDAVGSERAVVLGISSGAPTAALLAATHPARTSRLVFWGGFARLANSDDYNYGWDHDVLESYNRHTEADWGTGVGITTFAPSAVGRAGRERFGYFQRISASPGAIGAYLRALLELDVRHALPLISAPTLVIHAGRDRIVPVEGARAMAASIPDSRLVELASDDHQLQLSDSVEEIVDEIEAFVATSAPEREVERTLTTVLVANPGPPSHRVEVLIASIVERFRGRPMRAPGHATFDGPRQAMRCAVVLVDELAASGVDVGIGIHSGECRRTDGDVQGIALDVARQIAATAAPGTVLVSQTVRDLVSGSAVDLTRHGSLEVAGAPGRWETFTVKDPRAPRTRAG